MESCYRVACLPVSPVRLMMTACDPDAENGMITCAEALQQARAVLMKWIYGKVQDWAQ